MGRPEKPKTQLGQRLIAARKGLNFARRSDLADAFGLPKETLANYERGDSEPPAGLISRYRLEFGVNLSWLYTGEGSMFDDPSKAPAPAFDYALIEKLARLAERIHKEAGIRLSGEKLAVEAHVLYSELLARVSDLSDQDEIEATLPQLEYALKKRLKEAVAEPGTGKREVS